MENYTGIIIENKKAKIKALTKPTKKNAKTSREYYRSFLEEKQNEKINYASIRNKNYYYKKANLWNHFINRVEELENSYFNK